MSRVLVVATAGAGGDLQPLVALALALQAHGHEATILGDAGVAASLAGLPVTTLVLPSEYDLGPRLAAAVREAMTASDGRVELGGEIVEQRIGEWAAETSVPVRGVVRRVRPAIVLTSLFGVEVLAAADPRCPWVVVNSTFYIGSGSPRPIEQDVHPRAVPILRRYGALLDAPDLVLHATDQVFDFGFTGLPRRHHYVGPLGLWEPAAAPPGRLAEPGPRWVLVSISSQTQDDLPLVEAALAALAERPVRVVATVGSHPVEALGVPANARVERSVPHAAVLERADLLISHAGHGTVMKALWYGCPMILVPWGRDQPGVAARAEALGVAEVIRRDEASRETIVVALDRVFADRAMGMAARSHAVRLQATDPPAEAMRRLEPLL